MIDMAWGPRSVRCVENGVAAIISTDKYFAKHLRRKTTNRREYAMMFGYGFGYVSASRLKLLHSLRQEFDFFVDFNQRLPQLLQGISDVDHLQVEGWDIIFEVGVDDGWNET